MSNNNLSNDASITEKKLYEVTIWDKVFAGLPKENQLKNDAKYDYLLASEIEELKDENGDIKILTTYPSTLYTSTNKYNKKIYNEEVIAIPGGSSTMHIQYHNGKFITSDNR
ncbi:restriction endonuclease subunit S, partial [Mycoplasmopsis pullorum]